MEKFKPYIVGFLVGIVFTAIFGVVSIKVAKSFKPLIKKAIVKLSNKRYANVRKAQKDFMIANFERKGDLDKFTLKNTQAVISKEYASSGKQSAKVTFRRGTPSFRIGKYFERDKSFSNWAPYEAFTFDVYNPGGKSARLLLQIKDTRGDKYKQIVHIEAKEKYTVDVDVETLRRYLSIYRIGQINLFQWKPGRDTVLFIDNMRLLSPGKRVKKSIFDAEFRNSKEPTYATGDFFYFPAEKWLGNPHSYTFPIQVINDSGHSLNDLPVCGGIPFPKGVLKLENGILVKDKAGNTVPLQSKSMARWNDGSIKWLLLNISTQLNGAGDNEYAISFPVENKAKNINNLAKETPKGISVNTGKLEFFISKDRFRLFNKVSVGGKEVLSGKSDLLIKFGRDIYRSSNDKQYQLTLEENGPITSTIKAEGWFVDKRGRKYCKFVVRIKAYRNEPFVRIYHTFIYTGYPENKFHYLYKGKRLPRNETIGKVAIELGIPIISPKARLGIGADGEIFKGKDLRGEIKIIQTKDDHFEAKENRKKKLFEGKKLNGWVNLKDSGHGVSVIVRKLWQQYPKAFVANVKKRSLNIELWPEEAGVLDLKTTEKANGLDAVARGSAFGLAKTHELILRFHKGEYEDGELAKFSDICQNPPILIAAPEWTSDTRALGAVAYFDNKKPYFKKYENSIESLFDWGYRQQRNAKWYGMIDFGDVLTQYNTGSVDAATDSSNWYRDGRHGWHNASVMGLNLGSFLQFLRTGKYKYFEFGEDNTRHVMDIDTCHYNTVANDKRLKRRIPDDYSKVGSMHRHNADHWGGRNEMAGYTNLNGILLYYYLTGNERALDVAKEIGEFFLERPVIYYNHPDIAPGRAVANILWGEVALYEATQDERLKKEADYWANVFYRGQNRNGGWNEDYNPEADRWNGAPHHMYMTGYILPSLVDYHQLTENKAIAKCIIRMTDYLMKKNKYYPFFEGLSYSYYLTGDKKYLDKISKSFDYFVRAQRMKEDPLWKGMIFQKLTYTRNAYFVYSMPYAFEALIDGHKKDEKGGTNG